MWEIPPGQAAHPHHAHLTEEEIGVAERRPDGSGPSVGFRDGDAVGYREGGAPPDRAAGLTATAAGGPSGGHD
jgi:hypothetical protein